MSISEMKTRFSGQLQEFAADLNSYVAMDDGQWTVKGFIDIYRNVYTISSDTKIVSKILEIHLFPMLLKFAERHSYGLVVADHQNYYPDISFVSKDNSDIRFAVDFKTTYRLPANPARCNGFTLGSHGEYFTNRNSTKNIQFPYSTYVGHYCLGIIYTRADKIDVDETQVHQIEQLSSITSVIRDFQFFAVEKWQIASDKSGSGNTANIGSIQDISDIVNGRGMFSQLGEAWFDDYWMNYGKITTVDPQTGKTKRIRNLYDFVKYRNGDTSLIVPKSRRNAGDHAT
ncbi:MAG: EcoRV family type II restriction endonuclease [Caldilineaceae bacterium]